MDLPKFDPRAIQVRRITPEDDTFGSRVQAVIDQTINGAKITLGIKDRQAAANREKWRNRRPDPNRRVMDSEGMKELDEIQRRIMQRNQIQEQADRERWSEAKLRRELAKV